MTCPSFNLMLRFTPLGSAPALKQNSPDHYPQHTLLGLGPKGVFGTVANEGYEDVKLYFPEQRSGIGRAVLVQLHIAAVIFSALAYSYLR
ncbi:hypothetical protein CEXT_321541 [Caerostris extrusa]|uniref:Uncharacterized protein n=1 Tax=Caerostris extrusa TaxID=172846 RepID=A0AAV4MET7_CAEEX|nr:hypothetical protein CEXT_321541 [Caerostris extrusa]